MNNAAVFTTGENPGDNIRPSKPLLSYTLITDNSITISGSATDNIAVTSYDVYLNGAFKESIIGPLFSDYVVTGLSLATQYALYIVARDLAGNSSENSDSIEFQCVNPADVEKPTQPTISYSELTQTTVKINSSSTDNVKVVSFDIYLDAVLKETVTAQILQNYIVTGLVAETNYDIFTVAKDAAGNASDASPIINFTTLPTTPVPPTPTSRKPILSDFKVENANPNRVYFTANKSIAGMTSAGFKISGRSITSLVINGDFLGGYFIIDLAYKYGEVINIENLNYDSVAEFFPKDYVKNNVVFVGPEKYVTVSGGGLHDGSTEGNAWTLSEMNSASIAAGTRVNIKAGNYTGSITVRSGTRENRIIYEGYKTNKGDVTFRPSYGTPFSSVDMPLFKGTNVSGNYWMVLSSGQRYATIKNIQCQEYNMGVRSVYSTAVTFMNFDNVNFDKMGTPTLTSGQGYYMESKASQDPITQQNMIVNSYVANCSSTNYWLDGFDAFMYNNKSYSDITVSHEADTDYMFVSYHSVNACWRKLWAEKKGSTGHKGHGLDFKSNENDPQREFGCTDSFMIDCDVWNIQNSVSLRHSKTQRNKIINVRIDGVVGGNAAGGILIRDGASFNEVDGCTFKNLDSTGNGCVCFADNSGEDGANQICEGNIIKNCKALGSSAIVPFVSFGGGPGSSMQVKNNKFYNNSAYGWNCLYRKYSYCTDLGGNEFRNNNFSTFQKRAFDSNTMALVETNNNYWAFANSAGNPVGTDGNISIDPQFVDTIDLIPKNKALIVAPRLNDVLVDYNKENRSDPTTIGYVMHTDEVGGGTVVTDLFPQDNAASTITEVNAKGSWVANTSTVTSDPTTTAGGLYSIKIVTTNDTWGRGELDFTVENGAQYQIKIWAKRGTGVKQGFRSWIGFSNFVSTAIGSTTWTEYTFNLTANIDGAAKIRVYATDTTGGLTGDSVFVDRVTIIKL